MYFNGTICDMEAIFLCKKSRQRDYTVISTKMFIAASWSRWWNHRGKGKEMMTDSKMLKIFLMIIKLTYTYMGIIRESSSEVQRPFKLQKLICIFNFKKYSGGKLYNQAVFTLREGGRRNRLMRSSRPCRERKSAFPQMLFAPVWTPFS